MWRVVFYFFSEIEVHSANLNTTSATFQCTGTFSIAVRQRRLNRSEDKLLRKVIKEKDYEQQSQKRRRGGVGL